MKVHADQARDGLRAWIFRAGAFDPVVRRRHLDRMAAVINELPDDAAAWREYLVLVLERERGSPESIAEARKRAWPGPWLPPPGEPERAPWALRRIGDAIARPAGKVPALTLTAANAIADRMPARGAPAFVRLVLLVAAACNEQRGRLDVLGFEALALAIGARRTPDVRELLKVGTLVPPLWTWSARVASASSLGSFHRTVRIDAAPLLVELRMMLAPMPDPDDVPPLVRGARGHGPQWVAWFLFWPALRLLADDAVAHGGAFALPRSWWRDLAEQAGVRPAVADLLPDAYTRGPAPVLVHAAGGRFAIGDAYRGQRAVLLRGGVITVRARKGGVKRAANARRRVGRFADHNGLTDGSGD